MRTVGAGRASREINSRRCCGDIAAISPSVRVIAAMSIVCQVAEQVLAGDDADGLAVDVHE